MEKTKKYAITFEQFFRYRRVWMLLAVVWTVVFHFPAEIGGPLAIVKNIGYGGVDIFLFASGIGSFFSLKKNRNARAFLKRRMASILPMWLIFLAIFTCVEFLRSPMTLPQILGNVFGLGLFAGVPRQFNWYIGGMWACYLLAPVLYDVVCGSRGRDKVLVAVLFFLFSPVFWDTGLMIFFSRLPVFWLGMAAAEQSTRQQGITWKQVWTIWAVAAVGLVILGFFYAWGDPDWLYNYGMWWHPFALITPGLVLAISLGANAMKDTRLVAAADKLGRYTFPIYLSNVWIFESTAPLYQNGTMEKSLLSYGLLVLAVLAFAAVLQGLTVLFGKLLTKR